MYLLDQAKDSKGTIEFDNNIINFKDLCSLADKIKIFSKERPFIFLLCSNGIETLATYIASLKNNAVIFLIDSNIRDEQLVNLINIYYPNYIVKPKKQSFLDIKFLKIQTFINYEIFKNKINKKFKLHKDLSLLISTSGTTGSSKLVKLSFENIQNNTNNIIKFLNIQKKDKAITTLPFSYVYGLSIINTHLFSGASIVLNKDSIVQKSFWTKISKLNINNFGGVPYTYEILDKIKFYNKDLYNIKYTTHAGGKLNKDLWKKIVCNYKKLNIQFISMYGSSESTARMSYIPWKYSQKKMGSIGKPIPGGKFLIKDSKGKRILKYNKVGNLYYKGKNIFMGYSNKIEDLQKKNKNNNLLMTGDKAYRDKDNFFYLVSRDERFAKIFGHRINLSEIENSLLDIGITNICRHYDDNKIHIYLDNKNKYDKTRLFLKNNFDININIFKIKIFKTNFNGKITL